MRILITGAAGFVGGWLAEELAGAYPNATLYGMARHAEPGETGLGGMQMLAGDLNAPETLGTLVEAAQPDLVFHLAGFASGAGTDKDAIVRVNRDGTVNLLSALRRQEKRCRVQLASSGYVYGDTTGHHALETDVPRPHGAYPESKLLMEEAVRPLADPDQLPLTITRSFNHTGPRQTTEFVIPTFARQIARIERGLEPPVVRHGNLDALRDFLDVADVVRAYRLLLCETPQTEAVQIVNVCSGTGVTVRELLEQLVQRAQVRVTQETDPARLRPSDLPECIGNPARLQERTGWTQTRLIGETLAETLDYWRGVVAQDTT